MGDLVGELALGGKDHSYAIESLHVIVTPAHLLVQRISWWPYGGPDGSRAPLGPPRVGSLAPPEALRALLRPEEVDAIAPGELRWVHELIDRRRAWSDDQWRKACFKCFTPMREDGLSLYTPAAEAEWFELSTGLDSGVGPVRTLRLGRREDQFVDDHGRHFNARARTVVVRSTFSAGTPDGRAAVTGEWGELVADVASWFASDRDARFRA